MFQFKKRFLWRMTPATALSLAVIIFTICFGWLLPPSFGKENGPVENLQVVVLGFAALIAFSALFQTSLSIQRRKLYALSGVFLLLAIARELSWGRAFYMDSVGNIPPLKALWFGPAVYPALGVVLLGSIGYFFAKGLHKELLFWFKQGNFPMLDLVLVVVGMITADTIEHHSLNLFGDKVEVFEELFELAGYTAVLSFLVNAVFNEKFREN